MEITDLYTLDASIEGAEVQIRHPETGELLDCFITVKGKDSPTFGAAERAGKRKLLQSELDRLDDESYESLEKSVIAEVLAKSTVGWRGFMSKGKEIKFSSDKAFELYKNSPGIAEQVDSFIAKRANFTKG